MAIATRTSKHQSRRWAWLVFIVLLVMAISGYWYLITSTKNSPTPEQPLTTEQAAVQEKLPIRFISPDLGIDSDFEYLGIQDNGEVEVPESFEKVGWYMYSPLPGERGPSVVIGHVDSKDGPAIFYSLGQLKPGNEITIVNKGGDEIVYQVTGLARYSQNDFPTEKVYGDTDEPELRIITCTGDYSHEAMRYSHNLVVYAEMIEK